MREGIAFLAFTDRGGELARRLSDALGGTVSCTREDPSLTLDGWTGEQFPVRRALVYVGAVGIAVRAVAPYLRSKAEDPAVIAVDELGRFAVPLASGHLGGANELARSIAAVTGGTAVVTTATDLRGVFAVDEWARQQDCAVVNPSAVRSVSGKLLVGGTVRLYAAVPIAGSPPEGVSLTGDPADADVWVDVFRPPVLPDTARPPISSDTYSRDKIPPDTTHMPLYIVPRLLVLGTGCRRGTDRETLERRFAAFCERFRLRREAFRAAATIDIKTAEPGLLDFCAAHGLPLRGFSAAELRAVFGAFHGSEFVERTVGVDSVCERAAVRESGGRLLAEKFAGEGVTLAAALRPPALDWTWN